MKLLGRYFLFAVTSCICGAIAQAQTSFIVPTQIRDARKVFLGNGGSEVPSPKTLVLSNIVYTSFFTQLFSQKELQPVPAPKQADIAMEVAVTSTLSEVTNGTSYQYPEVRVRIRDPSSNTLLWQIDQPLNGAFREKTFRKNVDEAIKALLTQFASLR